MGSKIAMVILSILLLFLASYSFYNTSKKTIFQKSNIGQQIQNQFIGSRKTGALLLLASFICFNIQFGIAGAIFFLLVTLMTMWSLQLVLVPYFRKAK